MEPRIQYTRTSDGVSIAYWAMGHGRRLLLSPPMYFSHLLLEWQYPPLRAWYEQLARYRTVVRWDPRCFGLSARGTPGPVIGNILDVEAVLHRVLGEPCDIVAVGHIGAGAIEYAAAHAEDVANLAIADPLLRPEPLAQGQLEVIHALAERDETLWSESLARWMFGWDSGRLAHAYAEFIRASMNREDIGRYLLEIVNYNRTSLLPRLMSRVLVVSNPLTDWDRQHGRDVAAAIADAQFVETVNTEVRGVFVNVEESWAINEFLGIPAEAGAGASSHPSATAVILFADIADSTALTERLGDAAFREKARDLDGALRNAITEAGGTAVEGRTLGDGVLAVFASAREAIEAAQACVQAGASCGLPLHLGVHAGDVIREQGNVFGGAVNIASRIADASAPGEVLVSQTVRDLARTSAGVSFEDRGERDLKGVGEPVRVWAVRERDA